MSKQKIKNYERNIFFIRVPLNVSTPSRTISNRPYQAERLEIAPTVLVSILPKSLPVFSNAQDAEVYVALLLQSGELALW